MRFFAIICILLVVYDGSAIAGWQGIGLSKRPMEMLRKLGSDKLANLGDKAKQLGAGLLLAGFITCNMQGCSEMEEETTNSIPAIESPARFSLLPLDYDASASLGEHVSRLARQQGGSRIGIINLNPGLNDLNIETDDGITYLRLSKGNIVINNSEYPLKLVLYEDDAVSLQSEEIDSGWITEGSDIAIVAGIGLGVGVITLFGLNTFLAMADVGRTHWRDFVSTEVLTETGIGIFTGTTMGAGTYYLLTLL